MSSKVSNKVMSLKVGGVTEAAAVVAIIVDNNDEH